MQIFKFYSQGKKKKMNDALVFGEEVRSEQHATIDKKSEKRKSESDRKSWG